MSSHEQCEKCGEQYTDTYNKWLFEWIPYNQFNDIKETDKDGLCLAIWKDGPLIYDNNKNEYIRNRNQKVFLKYLSNSRNSINEFLIKGKIEKYYYKKKIYGITQNSDTKDYVMVFLDGFYCEKCGKKYKNERYKWCKPCQVNGLRNNFSNSTSENERNEKIDNLIQEMRLKINSPWDNIFEWIPYDQFKDIKEIEKEGYASIYIAIWKDGPLKYNSRVNEYTKNRQDERVTLKCLQNANEFFNEVKVHSVNTSDYNSIYGISQNPNTENYIMVLSNRYCENCDEKYTNLCKWCRTCLINILKKNSINWTSGNEKIDELIQEMQSRIDTYKDIIFDWIPYNRLNIIKETNKGSFITYIAIWIDGPLNYDMFKERYVSEGDKQVALRSLYDSHKNINEFLDEIKEYSINTSNINDGLPIYGISQDPDTKDYIMVFLNDYYCEECGEKYIDMPNKWCKSCQINYLKPFTTSKNEMIDGIIQTMQLKIASCNDIVFEWITYDQFDKIREISRGNFSVAIWKSGQLNYDKYLFKYRRNQKNEYIILKYLRSTQNFVDEFLNEIKAYSIKNKDDCIKIYGLTQNPDTKDYIMVISDGYCENCYDKYTDLLNKWCVGGFAKVYSAIWINDQLGYNCNTKKYERRSHNREVALKCLYNSERISDEFLNEVKAYSMNIFGNILPIHGISQNPDTKDYIMVLGYARGGNFNYWVNNNYDDFNWLNRMRILRDMGLCGKVDNMDQTKVYGVMPYVAPEVLKGNPYTKAADIYSFALKICNGIRPEISEPEAPKCYIDLMKKCLDSNPNNRPKAIEIEELIKLYYYSYKYDELYDELYKKFPSGSSFKIRMKFEKEQKYYEIEKQFKLSEEYRKTNHLYIKNNQSDTHQQAIYTSRLLNPYTKDLPEYDNIDNNSVEIIDFTL
ncbi:kinase-like domain-containing protein [Rhizophagus clarus]|uniref:Kinase-like domain-containing protein n=1 Tax=Rhizophagus clarus TaxID=94130 RepID=A0A8H3QAK9_9GLOM|nr:kinase-like domain-containing protein [Rhizophagus clarus]